jgi:hypothetical protein
VSDFIPDISQIAARLGLEDGTALQDAVTVQIDGAFLRFLISRIAATFDVDARAYRADNPAADEAGWDTTEPASAHFAAVGHLSGFAAKPRNFDENWYLSTYPDVRRGINEGHFDDALAHYLSKGRAEWRLPNAGADAEVRAWRKILHQPERARPIKLLKRTTAGTGEQT